MVTSYVSLIINIDSKESILNLVNCQAVKQNSTQVKMIIDDNKRVFVIGDLDANLTKFEAALTSVNFNPHDDILFSLGDVIDRGNNSVALLKRFKELGVYMCLGNHEHMLLESLLANDAAYYNLWVENGGRWHTQVTADELRFVCKHLLKCPFSYLVNYKGFEIGLSHTVSKNWDWQAPSTNKAHTTAALLWDRDIVKQKLAIKNKTIDFSVHGHNTTDKPYWLGNSFHIDTNYLSGKPTIVELKTLIKDFKQQH